MCEKLTLEYEDIAWAALDLWADTEVPTMSSTRYWQSNVPCGGEMGFAALLQLITQVLATTAGAVLGGTSDTGTLSGD